MLAWVHLRADYTQRRDNQMIFKNEKLTAVIACGRVCSPLGFKAKVPTVAQKLSVSFSTLESLSWGSWKCLSLTGSFHADVEKQRAPEQRHPRRPGAPSTWTSAGGGSLSSFYSRTPNCCHQSGRPRGDWRSSNIQVSLPVSHMTRSLRHWHALWWTPLTLLGTVCPRPPWGRLWFILICSLGAFERFFCSGGWPHYSGGIWNWKCPNLTWTFKASPPAAWSRRRGFDLWPRVKLFHSNELACRQLRQNSGCFWLDVQRAAVPVFNVLLPLVS